MGIQPQHIVARGGLNGQIKAGGLNSIWIGHYFDFGVSLREFPGDFQGSIIGPSIQDQNLRNQTRSFFKEQHGFKALGQVFPFIQDRNNDSDRAGFGGKKH